MFESFPASAKGLSSLTPARSAKWNTDPKPFRPLPPLRAWSYSLSASVETYLSDNRQIRWNDDRPASPQSLAMAMAIGIYS